MSGMDVSDQITHHLREAMRLSIEASGNRVGNYAVIAQATLNADGTFLMTWQRYHSAPGAPDLPA